ncbi:MAG TPA: vWA domain-containing protein [Thermoanaerobaculia bacterium]|nr:vWA domain-containing protein [Thermoanaerobaculia bacterium]
MIRRALFPVLALFLAAPVSAQPEVSSAAARTAQFVFVIDDSGSMDRTDPDRLAVFAVQSLINMLDDRDEVSLVRLNGPHDGAPPPPIQPLGRNRSQVLGLLALDKAVADYRGENTRCRSALEATQHLLNEAYRPEVAQVVMFLTDGECTPRGEEEPDVDRFLGGLRSRKDGLFQLYLLLFRGARATPAMAALASRTGGESIEVGGSDPTAILHPFATALSRSQGYESYLLRPADPRLAAHRGAERVRLLAVAPGEGPQLALSVHDRKGNTPRTTGAPRAGRHRYGNGRVFRFAALDYRPDVEPVTVSVAGAGDVWKVVALPEYRLSVRMSFHEGSCDRPGSLAQFGVDTGSTVCVVSELVNGEGDVVGGEVTGGDLRTVVRMRRPDQPGAPAVELAANPLPGGRARFGLVRSNLPKGDYEFQPEVTLRLSSGDAVNLKGRPMSLEVSSVVITPRPERFDFGALRPGESALRPLTLAGAFKPAPGRLSWRDRENLPACISAELSGVPEGKAQQVLVDQPYNLSLRVAPYCGPQSFRRPFDTVLRLHFDTGEGQRALPVVELPVRFTVESEIHAPRDLTARVKAGEAVDLPLQVTGNFRGAIPLKAVVAGPGDAGVIWPKDPEDLTLKSSSGGLQVSADRCCAGGSYSTQVALVPAAGQFRPEGAPPLDPILVPVRVEVVPAGFWACYGPRILWALAALLLLLLLLYVISMFRNSSFLKAEVVASKLKPLVWTAFGDAVEQKGSQQDVLRLARTALPLGGRILAWLKANPLRFGLPGRAYHETVEVFLRSHRDTARSSLALMAEPELQARMAREPETFSGRLFATALGGVTFLAVPDGSGRITGLAQQDGWMPATEEGKPKVVKLRRAKLLRQEGYEEDTAAGWQVG